MRPPPPPLEFDARLKAAVESPKRVLFANLLLNPFGPTLVYVFVLKSDAQSGRTANLYQAALHPHRPEYRCIGRIVFPKTWTGDWDSETLKKLAASLTGTELGTVLPPLWLAPSQRRELLASLYARDEDASRSLAVLEQAPDDIYRRFDIELEGLDQALLKPEQKARESLIDLSLSQAFAAREVGHFLQCWSHCERFFLHGNVSLAFAQLEWIVSADLKKEVIGF